MPDDETLSGTEAAGASGSVFAPRLFQAAVTAIAVTALVFGFLFVLAHRHAVQSRNLDASRAVAGVAAIHAYKDLTSLDYRNEADYRKRVSADTALGLQKEILASADAIFAGGVAGEKQVFVGSADRAAISINRASPSTAHALVLGHVTLTSSTSQGSVSVNGYSMTLEEQGGVWLVTAATALGGSTVDSAAAHP